MYSFGLITDLKSVFAISPKLSEEQAHLEQKVLAVGRLMGAARQTTQNKKLIHLSVLRHFQSFREKKTAYNTERFNKLCQLS